MATHALRLLRPTVLSRAPTALLRRPMLPLRALLPLGRWRATSSASADDGRRRGEPAPVTAQAVLARAYATAQPSKGSGADSSDDEAEHVKKLSATERVKRLMRKYGWVAAGVHGTVYTTTLSTIALLIHNGVDIVAVFKSIGLDRIVDLSTLNPSLGTAQR